MKSERIEKSAFKQSKSRSGYINIRQTLEQRQLLETREGHYNSDKRISTPGIQF